jgi:biotin-(acetyl-CoA carboxylase) ligase
MRQEPRRRMGNRYGRSLDLPPPFRVVVLREVGDAFAHACTHAAALGAGTLVFVGRFDLAEFAVVLEPEEPLAAARLVFYAGMVALADALAALAPPEKPITIDWPDAIRIDRGLVGGGRIGWPTEADERAVPAWLVFGASIRIVSMSAEGPGLHPLATALDDEGFGERAAERLLETFARYLMAAIDRWRVLGFPNLIRDYLSRLSPEVGTRYEIDAAGDFHRRHTSKARERRPLLPAVQAPSWLDPGTGGPRL